MNILFISASKYPSNSAEAARLHYLSQLFEEDHQVTIVSRGSSQANNNKNIEHISVSKQKLVKGNVLYRGLDYALFSWQIMRYLKTRKDADAIVFCALPTEVLRYLISYSKRYNILLIHDAVEWYSPEEFKLGKLDRLYRKKDNWMRKLLPGNCRIISISRFLQDYFERTGNKTVYVPSMIDTSLYDAPRKSFDGKIKLIYAGTPLKKDYLSVALDGIALLSAEKVKKLEICIIGISKEQAAKNGISNEVITKLGDSLVFMGRISRDEVFHYLKQAHFSILLRPAEQRYAKAGFPTKVPESLSVGTPVICNYSSDLGDFLTDGVNCIQVKSCNAKDMSEAIERILDMNEQTLNYLSLHARKLAIEKFDYRLFISEIRCILE